MKSLKVKDYMTKNVLCFSPDEDIVGVLRKLLKGGHAGGPVVDAEGNLVGMISEIDCLKETLQGGYYQQAGDSVREHMAKEVDKVEVEDDMFSTAELFLKGRRRLAVTDKGKLVGIITRQDFAKALMKQIDSNHKIS
jgi:predicted transcriptional regulator